jgi:peptide deformylase
MLSSQIQLRAKRAGAYGEPPDTMALEIVHFGDPILRKKGKAVTVFDAKLAQFADAMVETMHAAAGIGLAAQQVGRAIQLTVIDLRETDSKFTWRLDGAMPPLDLFMPMVLVNPELTLVPEPSGSYEEGCLSFPEIRGDIVRPDAIAVRFQDLQGQPHELTCDGLLARCIQHEVDHLNGILFIDRMDKKVLAAIEEPLRALKKATQKRLAKAS